jgi:hypothetical protein
MQNQAKRATPFLSATSQQFFYQYSSLRTNQHQPSATSQPNRLRFACRHGGARGTPAASAPRADFHFPVPCARDAMMCNSSHLRGRRFGRGKRKEDHDGALSRRPNDATTPHEESPARAAAAASQRYTSHNSPPA